MKIFAKRAFLLRNPDNPSETVTTKVLDFSEVPDWAKGDDTFKMAVNAGEIEIIGNKKSERAAEKRNSK